MKVEAAGRSFGTISPEQIKAQAKGPLVAGLFLLAGPGDLLWTGGRLVSPGA